MIDNINIRQATVKDIESIAKIKATGWQNAYKGIIDDEYLDAMSVKEQIEKYSFSYKLKDIFIAENQNEVVGFCRFYDYNAPAYDDKEIDCEIREIYIKPDLKRMGIGSQLFKYTLDYFKSIGKKKLYLGCFKENYNSRKFYEKMGGILGKELELEVGNKKYKVVSYIYEL